MYNLQNRSILVTGGSSGMGRQAALLAASAGASVTVGDIAEAEGRETVRMIASKAGVAQFVRVDISNEDDVEQMVAAAVSAYGTLDGAYNNAAIPQQSVPLHSMSVSIFRRAMEVNVLGTFLCMKHEIRAMLKHNPGPFRGAIVNCSSAGGVVAFPCAAEYIASKHAVLGVTKSAALDYASQGIRVNAVLPGATMTPMFADALTRTPEMEQYCIDQQPLGRLARPDEIASVAVWLLSDHASFVTGACIPVDGGYTSK